MIMMKVADNNNTVEVPAIRNPEFAGCGFWESLPEIHKVLLVTCNFRFLCSANQKEEV